MIRFDETTKTFFLRGEKFDYAMKLDPSGHLEHVHFGGRISEDDFSCLVAPYFLPFNVLPPGEEIFCADISPSEYGSYGQGDFRAPSFLAEQADGWRASRLVYVSHEIFPALPSEDPLPRPRGGLTLRIRLRDEISPLAVELFYTVCGNALVRHVELVNGGKEPIRLKKANSFCFELPSGDYDAFALHGRHCAERTPERTPLPYGTFRIGSSRGVSSHQSNPFLTILARNASEDAGECYGAELLYSGSFALTAERSQTGAVRVQGGVDDLGFSWELKAGERFAAPSAALFYSDEGLGGLSRAAADFIRDYVYPPEGKKPRPVVANNWEATYFGFTEEKLLSLIDEAAVLGADVFVLDDGWFGTRDDDSSSLGDWFVNRKKLPRGLAPLISRCKEKGMRFGIWIEPEMVSENSELFRKHPDWPIGKAGERGCTSRNQRILDFSRPEVVAGAEEQISRLLAENEISYVKWDMNRHASEFYSNGLPPERQGELQHRYVLGVYALAKRLKEKFPHVFFEGCSGGGGRFDAGMLYYFPQIWTSDDTDAFERAKIQWGTGYAYPLCAMSCHVSACPNHQTGRITPFSSRGTIASLGATGYELDLDNLSEEEKALVRAQIAHYREIEPLLLHGDLYRLLDPFSDDYFAEEVLSKDKKTAYVAGMQILSAPTPVARRLRLKGLDESARYRVKELDAEFGGDSLSSVGLPLPALGDFVCFAWHLERTESPKK